MAKKIHIQKIAGSGNPESICEKNENKWGNVELDFLTTDPKRATCRECKTGYKAAMVCSMMNDSGNQCQRTVDGSVRAIENGDEHIICFRHAKTAKNVRRVSKCYECGTHCDNKCDL